MNTQGLHLNRAKPVVAAVLAVLALVPTMQPARAQDAGGNVGDFRLPPGSERPSSPVQGPVDDQVPVVRPTRAAPPEPQPQPAVTPTPAPAATTTPAAPATPRAVPANRVRPPEASAPVAEPASPAATPPAPAMSQPALPVSTPTPMPSAAPSPIATEPAAERGSVPGWLIGLAGIALLGVLAIWFLRRKRRDTAAVEAEWTSAPAENDIPDAQPVAPSPPASLPRQAATPLPASPPATATSGALAVELDAHHLSRSLVYVTLAYRLTLANRGSDTIGPLRVAADLASAHASRSREAQLRPAPGELEQRHAIPALSSGESVTVTGELRLPVAAILAIQQGVAQLFVPLARFLVEGEGVEPRTFVFVIGQPGETPGAGLRPFRIDAMPGVFRDLDQREIAIAA